MPKKDNKNNKISPGRKQYLTLKKNNPNSLLLVRMGDFYEAFEEDAKKLSEILGIALTSRDAGGGVKTDLSGIPYHSLDKHLSKLVNAGIKVAIAEQTSDPKKTKGLVSREVTKIITSGTVTDPELLDKFSNNYLLSISKLNDVYGLAYLDISTSEFEVLEIPKEQLNSEISKISPREIIIEDLDLQKDFVEFEKDAIRISIVKIQDTEKAKINILRHFKKELLSDIGLEGLTAGINAVANTISYIADNQMGNTSQIATIEVQKPNNYLQIDTKVINDLDLLDKSDSKKSLFSILNYTSTSMGARNLKSWIIRPLINLESIISRQNIIEFFVTKKEVVFTIQSLLKKIPDIERLSNKIRAKTVNPRDLISIKNGIKILPEILQILRDNDIDSNSVIGRITKLDDLVTLIENSIVEDPSILVGDGKVVREGYNKEFDDIRNISNDARASIAKLESEYKDRTGIKNLRIGYNRVFGYFIEVSNSNKKNVPEDFQVRQTLTNSERYITSEIKDLESKILNARDLISDIEKELYLNICEEISFYTKIILSNAKTIASLDSILSLATATFKNGWSKPVVNDGIKISFLESSHPIVESNIGKNMFIKNDIFLSNDEDQIAIITGPNMSGKSTYIRQAALLVILSQIGSFIPAKNSIVGIIDKIFTRAGLSDDISGGNSTFMIEMLETASILNQSTNRSLAILDEIGRGTSTYDGLAIATAIVEFIHNTPSVACKTLFATHYHEMTEISSYLPRVCNLKVQVSEDKDDVIFLHKIVKGAANKSYGVHVAKLAGIPENVIIRAGKILKSFENEKNKNDKEHQLPMDIFDAKNNQISDELINQIKNIDVENITPLEAINKLYDIKKYINKQG
ncbi:MAG: DNA mismatch repair protein MutS [Chloroflexi bacterium]|nr:DNA mismatch repair protein MutS [Chloroflexota bacterium]